MRLIGIRWDVTCRPCLLPFRPRSIPETEPVLAAAAGTIARETYVPLASGTYGTRIVELVFDMRLGATLTLDGRFREARKGNMLGSGCAGRGGATSSLERVSSFRDGGTVRKCCGLDEATLRILLGSCRRSGRCSGRGSLGSCACLWWLKFKGRFGGFIICCNLGSGKNLLPLTPTCKFNNFSNRR